MDPMSDTTKYLLPESSIPKSWYNIAADLPEPLAPVLHPGTGQPIGPDDLAPLFPMALIGQEVTTEREIEIPEPVRDVYKLWRPAPLYRARRLEADAGRVAKQRWHLLHSAPHLPGLCRCPQHRERWVRIDDRGVSGL